MSAEWQALSYCGQYVGNTVSRLVCVSSCVVDNSSSVCSSVTSSTPFGFCVSVLLSGIIPDCKSSHMDNWIGLFTGWMPFLLPNQQC